VTNFYRKKNKENPDYEFKNALKDAAKIYKKTSGVTEKAPPKTGKSLKTISKAKRGTRKQHK
jgi:hypothetical protein